MYVIKKLPQLQTMDEPKGFCPETRDVYSRVVYSNFKTAADLRPSQEKFCTGLSLNHK
jgi:hypothetical protein